MSQNQTKPDAYTKTNIYFDVYGTAHQIVHRLIRKSANPNKEIKFLSTNDEIDYYLNALHEEFSVAVSKIAKLSVHNIVLLFDPIKDKSFRYEIFQEYKQSASRTKERKYCKDGFKTAMEKYYGLLRDASIKALRVDGLEADDLLFLMKKHTVGDENICIISSDGDLKQLMDNRTFVYNNIYDKIYVSENLRSPVMQDDVDTSDAFGGFFGGNISQVDDMLNRNHEMFFVNATVVNPEHSLIEKILIGDTSDNIDSCFKYKTKNGAKEYGFTDKRFASLIENGETITMSILNNKRDYQNFLDIMTGLLKIPARSIEQKVKDYEMLCFNKSLIDLSEGYARYSRTKDVEKIGETIENLLSTPNVPLSRLVIEAPIGIDY